MKQVIIIVIVVLIFVFAFGAFTKFLGRPVSKPVPQKSEIFYVSGDVLIKKADSEAWEKAKPDMAAADGDAIKTSDKSAAEIKFGKGEKNFVALGEDTAVTLKKISVKGDKNIELNKGSVLSLISELDANSRFEVRTPTAVCGVEGTGFETTAKEKVAVIKVYEGEVRVAGTGLMGVLPSKAIEVKEGTTTYVEKNRPPAKPTAISNEDLERWRRWKGDLDSHLFRTFYVFLDENDTRNHYYPSGWVGDYDAIRRVASGENAYSGKDCLRFKYTGLPTQGAGWAGVYWQNPVNNWGDVKGGYYLKGAKRLTFYARGEKGGEKIVRFGIGGIGGEYPDSAKAEIGPVVLEKEWRRHEIDLSDKDLSYISAGFYWMTDKVSNPEGAVFYLDEIKYE